MSGRHPFEPSPRAVLRGTAAVALSPVMAKAQSETAEAGPRAGDRVVKRHAL